MNMRRVLVVAVVGLFGAAAVTAPALAAKPVDGVSSIVMVAPAGSDLGDTVSFTTTVEPLAHWEYPMVDVQCYQDVDGDGIVDTRLSGNDVVFTALVHPDESVTLGGYSSIWTNRGGGAAACLANLDAYGFHAGTQTIRVLDSVAPWTAGG